MDGSTKATTKRSLEEDEVVATGSASSNSASSSSQSPTKKSRGHTGHANEVVGGSGAHSSASVSNGTSAGFVAVTPDPAALTSQGYYASTNVVAVGTGVNSDISFKIVVNDGTEDNHEDLIHLKNIFSKQLPKMPREYIVRLVLDKRHISLAIRREGRIIGGICYRPYYEQRFGEIAFCAISGTEQVRGFGTMLMNQLKAYVQKDKIEYFLTYADNYAIGYFQKQGFSKIMSMPRERWVGYIKDYDGGTLMECYIHPSFDYVDVPSIIARQRAFIYEQVIKRSRSGIVHPGLEFLETNRLTTILEAPGVVEAGWTHQRVFKGATERDPHSWPFENAVSSLDFPDYPSIVDTPMDLKLISSNLKLGDYYRTKEQMMSDLLLIVSNCKKYNKVGTELYEAAENLELQVKELFKDKDASATGQLALD
eukprot:GSChrysophyteH2.ASY1.ANO1.1400.1 assembled CDS